MHTDYNKMPILFSEENISFLESNLEEMKHLYMCIIHYKRR